MGEAPVEYIWIDNFHQLRSKARTLKPDDEIPVWNFDGSSTGQSTTTESEVFLRPRAVFPDPFRGGDARLTLCDCYDNIGIPVKSNTRCGAEAVFKQYADLRPWYGLEQEYVIYDPDTGRPLGWPADVRRFPPKQGPYYCGVGADRVFGREIADEHYRVCLETGLTISGINGEVMPGQWEFQIGPVEGIAAADQLWVARYLLHRVAEKYGMIISFDPKPIKDGDWNGSGLHTNFSTTETRTPKTGIHSINKYLTKLAARHGDHLAVYGDNSKRLTGHHETSDPQRFTFGIGSRGASVRIPNQVADAGFGYFEDRRPAADADPYIVTMMLLSTCCGGPQKQADESDSSTDT